MDMLRHTLRPILLYSDLLLKLQELNHIGWDPRWTYFPDPPSITEI